MLLPHDLCSAIWRSHRWLARGLTVWLTLTAAAPLWAQLPHARLHWIYPPGGQCGTSVEVTLSGVDLDDAREIIFSHPGLTAAPQMAPPRSFEKEPRQLPNQFVVKIADDVPPGIYEARVLGRYGLSTPRAFAVGTLPEAVEQGANNSLETPMPIELNSVTNGRVAGDSYDVYRFTAKGGQRVLIQCDALRIDSRMDATLVLLDAAGQQLAYSRDARRNEPMIDFIAPADGDYLVQVYDFLYQGGEPYYYRLSVSTQPHLDFVFPPSGEPGTTGKFTLYGRNLPGGVPADGVSIDGAPLEKLEVEIAIPAESAGSGMLPRTGMVDPAEAESRGFEYRLENSHGPSNPVFITFAAAPVVTEQEPNDERSQAQPVTVPCELVGQFFPRRDRDWVSFQAKRGESFAVEVCSQRRGLPTDPYLLVQHVSKGEQGEEKVRDIAESDDIDAKFGNPPFDTPVRDAALVFTADADGEYRVLVRDLYAGSTPSPRHVYSLTIRPPQPDFQLLATSRVFTEADRNKLLSAAPILRQGGSEIVVVQAYRRDGFTGPITLTAIDLPAGVTCSPVVLAAGENRATLILRATADAPSSTSMLHIIGTASVDGKELRRTALGSSVVWDKNNNNETTYARVTRDLMLSVIAEPQPISVAIAGEPTRQVSRAGKLSIPVQVTRREGVTAALALNAQELPKEIKAAALTLDQAAQQANLEITLDANAPLGPRSFYLGGQIKTAYQRNPEAAQRAEEEKKQFAALVAQLTEASQAAEAAKAAAEKKVAELAAMGDKPELAAERQAAEAAKAQAIEAAQRATETLKAAQEEQKIVDKRAADLASAAQAKEIDVFVQSPPVTLAVVAAPIDFTATPPPAAIPQGGQGEIVANVQRRFEFAEVIAIAAELPKNVTGITIDGASVAADQSLGKLVVKAAANATPGEHQVVLHAKLKYNGQDLQVSQPLTVTIAAVDAAKE